MNERTHDGEIHSDFSDLKVENSDDRGTATGTVVSGGPRMVLNNEHGGIEIRKGSIAPMTPEPPPAHPAKPVKPAAVPEVTDN